MTNDDSGSDSKGPDESGNDAVLATDPTTSDDADAAATEKKRKSLPIWQESVLLVAVALVLAVIIKALFVQAFYIPSASMNPGLVTDDRIVVQKVSYWFGGSPSRGDVVVFEDPGGWLTAAEDTEGTSGFKGLLADVGLYPSGGHLVKRVIGISGDVITCCDSQGRISVNGKPLDEKSYIADGGENIPCNGPMIAQCDWTAGPVPEGNVFVMGDNRGNSADSTVHLCLPTQTDCTLNPYVDEDLVVGKVFGVIWPRDHFHLIGTPDSFDDVPAPG